MVAWKSSLPVSWSRKLRVSYVQDLGSDVMGWAWVGRHATSLRLLYVDGLDGKDPGLEAFEFEQMCSKCDKLEQLAMVMPTWQQEVLRLLVRLLSIPC